MKTQPVLSSEEAFVLNQAIMRRILVLQDRMLEAWNSKDDHKLKHDARQVALLWGLFHKVSHVSHTGKWPEEKS